MAIEVTLTKLIESSPCIDLKLVITCFLVPIQLLDVSLSVHLFLVCLRIINVTRTFVIKSEGCVELKTTVLAIAIVFDVVIPSLLF